MIEDDDRFAPPGKHWKCPACGKTSEKDRFGMTGKVSRGWDEACMMRAVLVPNDDDL